VGPPADRSWTALLNSADAKDRLVDQLQAAIDPRSIAPRRGILFARSEGPISVAITVGADATHIPRVGVLEGDRRLLERLFYPSGHVSLDSELGPNSYQLFKRCAKGLGTMPSVFPCGRKADVLEHRLFLIGADIAQR
jgi:hypothetical protein